MILIDIMAKVFVLSRSDRQHLTNEILENDGASKLNFDAPS